MCGGYTAVGGVVVVRLGNAVSMWTDPLTTALTDNGDKLCVATVRQRRRSIFLWTQRRARIRTVLTRAQPTAVGTELIAVFVHLTVDVTRLRSFR